MRVSIGGCSYRRRDDQHANSRVAGVQVAADRVTRTPPAVRASLTRTYRKHLKRHLRPVFGGKRLDEITRAALLDFRGMLTRSEQERGKGLKMKTARDIIDGTFRALYRD